jgi:hypothetical protein
VGWGACRRRTVRLWSGGGAFPTGPGFHADYATALAYVFDHRKLAFDRRGAAEAALEQAHGKLLEATAGLDRQLGRLQAADGRLAEQVAELASAAGDEGGVAAFSVSSALGWRPMLSDRSRVVVPGQSWWGNALHFTRRRSAKVWICAARSWWPRCAQMAQ